LGMLAVLNSSVARRLLEAINPTVNFQVGDLAELPVPPAAGLRTLHDDVAGAIGLTRTLDSFDETEPGFRRPMFWHEARDVYDAISRKLRTIERRLENAVAELYGLPVANAQAPPAAEASRLFDPTDLARRWISHALRQVLTAREAVQTCPVDASVVSA